MIVARPVIRAAMMTPNMPMNATITASESCTHRLVITEAEHPSQASGWAPNGFSTGGREGHSPLR